MLIINNEKKLLNELPVSTIFKFYNSGDTVYQKVQFEGSDHDIKYVSLNSGLIYSVEKTKKKYVEILNVSVSYSENTLINHLELKNGDVFEYPYPDNNIYIASSFYSKHISTRMYMISMNSGFIKPVPYEPDNVRLLNDFLLKYTRKMEV